MANPNYRTTAEWFWLGVYITAGLGFMIALLSYTGSAQWAIALMTILGSLCFSKAAYDLRMFTAPHHIGTPIRTLFVLAVIWGGMGFLGSEVWPTDARISGVRITAPEGKKLQPLAGDSGDTFPLLKDSTRPFEEHSYGSFEGNLKARLIAIADKLDAYRTENPLPAGPPAAVSEWYHARSEDFRANILPSLVDIHDELKWFHYRDADLDDLLGIESYKEQINESGGMSDDVFGANKGPKHKLDASSEDLDKTAIRLRALAEQMKTP